jgi:aryl-alcohol dehydrogenase-like predicted oxidoreductase
MPTAQLGPFTIGRLALGAVQMGGKIPPPETYRMLDRFLEAGAPW